MALKRRLSTIFGGFNEELKGNVNAAYLLLGDNGEVTVDDRDEARIFNDLLASWIRGAKYIMKKEALGAEMVENSATSSRNHLNWKTCQSRF